MVEAKHALYYVADPMCSWCWGFAPVLERVADALPPSIPLIYVMGGLAPDSDAPMPDATIAYVQQAWREVHARTGATFNWDFWTRCQPRRSTYPACRAVLAAATHDLGAEMFRRIQQAYYQEARNPSDLATLVELGAELGLEQNSFAAALTSPAIDAALAHDFAQRRSLGIRSFPSLVLQQDTEIVVVAAGYTDYPRIEERLHQYLGAR